MGWAGLLFHAPDTYRFARVDGDADDGGLRLADEDGSSIDAFWARVTRRKFDARKYLVKRLRKAMPRRMPEDVKQPGFDVFIACEDREQGVFRYMGYCEKAGRVIDFAFKRSTAASENVFKKQVLPTLRDQPLDQPHRWAFFDTSFVAPIGFRYAWSKLNVGDMSVGLHAGKTQLTGDSITVRQVYPAALALSRQPLTAWLDAWAGEHRKTYRAAGLRRVGGGAAETRPFTTPMGEAIAAEAPLRRMLRVIHWSAPRASRFLAMELPRHDRIVMLHVAAKPERIDPLLRGLIEGQQWA